MPVFDGLSRNDILPQLQRVLGVHRWTLNLATGLMRLEYGRVYGETRLHEVHREELARLLGPRDMRLYHDHWEAALRNGHHGPVNLPFANGAGDISVVESACALHTQGEERFLVGVFKRIHQRTELGRNARLLSEFLESFITHSPSSIVVVDSHGKIVSANREFIRFIGKTQRAEVVQKPALDMVYAVSAGFGQVMREALRQNGPTRGRYEMTLENALRQTLYWRAFPLSMDAAVVAPHVFAFDLNENGARRVAA
jgi:PAS domain-containing protein